MNIPASSHAQVSALLAPLKLPVSVSELHGALTGYLSGGGSAGPGAWLGAVQLEADAAPEQQAALRQLYRECRERLDDPELAFEPLLPDDAAALTVRGEALVDWCHGFVSGFGLAGAGADAAPLSGEAKEILADFSHIAGTEIEYDDAEQDENSLAEVVEFVRVGVLLIAAEFARAAPSDKPTVH